MTLMGWLEPESAAISKNVKIIQIRAEMTNLGGLDYNHKSRGEALTEIYFILT